MSDKSLTNWIKPKGLFGKFVSDSRSLYINKIPPPHLPPPQKKKKKKKNVTPYNSIFVIKVLQMLPKCPVMDFSFKRSKCVQCVEKGVVGIIFLY